MSLCHYLAIDDDLGTVWKLSIPSRIEVLVNSGICQSTDTTDIPHHPLTFPTADSPKVDVSRSI